MQTDDNIRRYYDKYAKRGSKSKSPSINSTWGYLFFLAGVGLAILFLAFTLQIGFNNSILLSMGIVSVVLVIIGLVILTKSD